MTLCPGGPRILLAHFPVRTFFGLLRSFDAGIYARGKERHAKRAMRWARERERPADSCSACRSSGKRGSVTSPAMKVKRADAEG